jgi:hypothetical protein
MSHKIISEHAMVEPLMAISDRVSYNNWERERRFGEPVVEAGKIRMSSLSKETWIMMEMFQHDSINLAIFIRYFGRKETAGFIAAFLRRSRKLKISTEEVEKRIQYMRRKFAAIQKQNE